jgi:GT2 family glycosyltransferase
VVVDSDPSSGCTAPIAASFHEVRYVPYASRGLSGARNAGIRNATGDVIAFTGDDVTVHRGWIAALRRAFHDPSVSASTGLVLPAELRTLAQYLCSGGHWSFRAAHFGPEFFRNWIDRGVPTWRIGSGVNMAFRRDVFDRCGYFDERLGAGAAGSSEDSEFWYRLLAAERSCRYDPAAVVFAHRTDDTPLSTQTFNYMRGHVAALLFQFDRHRHWGNIARVFRTLPVRFLVLAFGVVKRAVLTEASEGNPLFVPLLPQVLGAIAGGTYYVRYRRTRMGPDDRQGE